MRSGRRGGGSGRRRGGRVTSGRGGGAAGPVGAHGPFERRGRVEDEPRKRL